MDNRTRAYLRERRSLSGTWNPIPRIAAGLIGAAIGVLTPGNPTPLENAVFTFLKGVVGFVLVEALAYAYRFVVVVPKTMYFDALDRVKTSETTAAQQIEAAESRCRTKLKTYTANIQTLEETVSLLQAQLERKEKDQVFADVLTAEYVLAVSDIMNAPEVQKPYGDLSAADWREWNRREQAWTEDVRQLLEQHGCKSQIVAHFMAIHEFPYNQFHHFQYVSSALSMFSERLKRLKAIISDYAEVPILKDR